MDRFNVSRPWPDGRIGVALLAVGSVAAGISDLLWREFEPAHQPIQAFGDHIPGRLVFLTIAAALLIGGGLAILWRRTARYGALALAVIYLAFALFWLPRFIIVPRLLGVHLPVYIGLADGMATQLIVVIAAVLLYLGTSAGSILLPLSPPSAARWIFGLCSITFGLGHLTAIRSVATMIRPWMPFGADFWVVLSGIAFLLAGLAILSGVQDVLAARLLALMLLLFSVFILLPLPVASPRNHVAWGANAYNLAAAGATLVMAQSLAAYRAGAQREHRAPSSRANAGSYS